MSKCEISSIDHIVMTVADMSKTIDFYCSVLGTTMVEFAPPTGGPVRKSLHFGKQKINLHDAAAPYVPHAKAPQAGSVDLCFISTQPLDDWQRHLASHGVSVEEGPVRKTGANGPLMSLYIRDPDGNLIEISNYI
ncbi:MAG: VOC family protein [Candidatus Puniceispirillaceae bacterium]|jgi:catechol 2,3-dioxygenase-like lactoylglutathione lyase family enzyme|nr:VOC family protein [Pseudomonadota bacterium]